MSDKDKRLTVELDEHLFYKLKELCVKNKTTLKEFLTELIKRELDKN